MTTDTNNMLMSEAVEEYQCPGCFNGSNPQTCERVNIGDAGCHSHHPATIIFGLGTIALGMPKGFNRFGPTEVRPIEVYKRWEDIPANCHTIFSLPVWKYLDKNDNTVVRWFSPRTNYGWSTVIMGDVRDKMPNALEITQEQLDNMD